LIAGHSAIAIAIAISVETKPFDQKIDSKQTLLLVPRATRRPSKRLQPS
jgi:hypothetical protein